MMESHSESEHELFLPAAVKVCLEFTWVKWKNRRLTGTEQSAILFDLFSVDHITSLPWFICRLHHTLSSCDSLTNTEHAEFCDMLSVCFRSMDRQPECMPHAQQNHIIESIMRLRLYGGYYHENWHCVPKIADMNILSMVHRQAESKPTLIVNTEKYLGQQINKYSIHFFMADSLTPQVRQATSMGSIYWFSCCML